MKHKVNRLIDQDMSLIFEVACYGNLVMKSQNEWLIFLFVCTQLHDLFFTLIRFVVRVNPKDKMDPKDSVTKKQSSYTLQIRSTKFSGEDQVKSKEVS